MDAYLKEDIDVDVDEINGITLSEPIQRGLAGLLASSFTRVVVQPMEIVKLRFQLQGQSINKDGKPIGTDSYRSIWQAMRLIRRSEGLSGLWSGHYISQVQGLSQGVAQFSIYSEVRKSLHRSSLNEMTGICDFLAGFISGGSCVIFLSPLDQIRTLVMQRPVDEKPLKARAVTRYIYQQYGIRGFYHSQATLTSLFHVSTSNGLKFMIYNYICRWAIYYQGVKTHAELSPGLLFLSGAAAGFIPNALTYPMEVVRRRLQVSASNETKLLGSRLEENIVQCKRIVQCVIDVTRMEAPLALYKGFTPSALKSIISTSLQFSLYDLFYEWINTLRF